MAATSASLLDFQTLGRQSSEDVLGDMLRPIMPDDQFRAFMKLFAKFNAQRRREPDWEAMQSVPPEMLTALEDLEPCPADEGLVHELLDKAVVLKLNGGLGTSLGCLGPKSALTVRDDQSFLDLSVRQVEYINSRYGVDVPLVLMDSFKTHDATSRLLRRFRGHNITIHSFTQGAAPRLDASSLLPLPREPFSTATRDEWTPPGHGEVFSALFQSGLLATLIDQGKEYIYISNIDNLGGTLNLEMLYSFVNSESEMMAEVVSPTRTDRQGGLFVVDGNGRPELIELSQVPEAERARFAQFKAFNTNSLCVSLGAIQRLVAQDALDAPVNVMERELPTGQRVVQLETAAGGAIRQFADPVFVVVPRRRFLPVKTTADLMLLRSNLYELKHGVPVMSAVRDPSRPPPVIKLSHNTFGSLAGYADRVKDVPDVVDLDSLTVSGDVVFGRGVTLAGTVIIVANAGGRIYIPDGARLENVVVSGSLSIVEH